MSSLRMLGEMATGGMLYLNTKIDSSGGKYKLLHDSVI